MALIIQSVLARSLAAKAGILPQEVLISINGNRIQDFFDLQYHSSDYELNLELQDLEGAVRNIQILRERNKPLGIEPETYHCRFCQNRCIFCFIDQMPPQLRDTLYVKDDDYLYSFIFGNYITLTNLRNQDFQRIIDQHISPLYVSVHTTDSGLRKLIMRYRQDFELLRWLKKLSSKGIEFHFQIVLVPGFNDGEALKESIRTLLHPKINSLSIGLVPVGLTKYRDNLPEITPFDPAKAQTVLDTAAELSVELGSNIIYCADELFVLADQPIPPSEYYQDYPQLENGIGMLRLMLENFRKKRSAFLKELKAKDRDLVFVTGLSAHKTLMEMSDYLNRKLDSERVRVLPVINNYLGQKITVSGLLTFKDIVQQVKVSPATIVALPNNIFNQDGLTLDGFGQIDLKEKLGCEVLVIDHLFEDWDWI
jgi:putative radical SAM enzyme (TIGR03279 family)